MAIPKIPKFKPLANASEGTKKILKPLLIGVIGIMAVALGLETTNNDWDLNKMMSGQSASESKIMRDEKGNIKTNEAGEIVTRVMRDKEGNVVTENGKYTDEYNCNDFDTKDAAQKFFTNAGGVSKDTNRLDGDKDGQACESLPNAPRE